MDCLSEYQKRLAEYRWPKRVRAASIVAKEARPDLSGYSMESRPFSVPDASSSNTPACVSQRTSQAQAPHSTDRQSPLTHTVYDLAPSLQRQPYSISLKRIGKYRITHLYTQLIRFRQAPSHQQPANAHKLICWIDHHHFEGQVC